MRRSTLPRCHPAILIAGFTAVHHVGDLHYRLSDMEYD
jgi:hypothetical protein